jgi:hypothetical protein
MRRVLPLLALLAVACDDDGPTPLPTASFTLQVELDSPLSISGDATFSADLGNSGVGTAFALRDEPVAGTLRHSIAIFRFIADPLAPGEYPIVIGDETDPPEGFRASLSLERDGADPLSCYADGGVLRVTSADAARVVATLTLQGVCAPASDPATTSRFTATGSLDAAAGLLGPGEVPTVGALEGDVQYLAAPPSPPAAGTLRLYASLADFDDGSVTRTVPLAGGPATWTFAVPDLPVGTWYVEACFTGFGCAIHRTATEVPAPVGIQGGHTTVLAVRI